MWASHFVRNGNELSISSWLASEVQVCRNVGRPNPRLPNLVFLIVTPRCVKLFNKCCFVFIVTSKLNDVPPDDVEQYFQAVDLDSARGIPCRNVGQPVENMVSEDYSLSTDDEDGYLDVSISNCFIYYMRFLLYICIAYIHYLYKWSHSRATFWETLIFFYCNFLGYSFTDLFILLCIGLCMPTIWYILLWSL